MQTPDDVEEVYGLTNSQQGVLFHTLYAPGSGVYMEQLSLTLQGALDVSLFEQALRTLVVRHPILRTSFHWSEPGPPVQKVHLDVPVTIEVLDHTTLSGSEQRRRRDCYLSEDRRRGFDLREAPLFRMTLVRTGSEHYEFLWSFSQLILDSASVALALGEVLAVFRALQDGSAADLQPTLGYQAYVAWQEEQDRAEDEAYWADRLRGFTCPGRLEVGSVPRLDSEQPLSHESAVADLSDLCSRVQAFADAASLTRGAVLQGAWMILVGRHTGDEDIVVGSANSCRPALGESGIMGPMVVTLPIRATVKRDRPVRPWLLELEQAMAEARKHGSCSLVEMQQKSEVRAGQPLFESVVMSEEAPLSSGWRNDVQLRLVEASRDARPHYPITLEVSAGKSPSEPWAVRLVYDRRRFRPAMATALLKQFKSILCSIASSPEQAIGDLDWLGDEERERLLLTWNDTARTYARETGFHHAIERRAEETPDALALVFESGHMTYGELNARANQLAHELLSRGADGRTPIAVLMERSPEMVISLLAVIKTGSAYLPIEPAYPERRRAQMLTAAGANLVVTGAELAPGVGELDAQLVEVSSGDALRADASANPRVPVGPDSPLYVIFTSGSTGAPKGVVNQHGALCNRLQWMQEQFGLQAGERVLQKTPFTFDVSVWEIFWPLRVGATLVLASPGGQRDPIYLAELIERERVSTVHFVPSLLQVFLDVPDLGRRCASLTRIVCSGEELPRMLADRCQAALRAGLFNLYGPTEAAIDVSWWQCQADHNETALPIGRPIANTQLYLLDDQKRPVPVGAKGELHIAGSGLAAGYAGRPDLTAERFAEVTLPGVGRCRVYCTSDLARFREDGAIEYCGRSDHQIKLRGYRIELGEIECALRGAPGVKDAVVTVQDLGPDRLLVAHVVGVGARATQALRRFLRERLPEYMVPARFVALPALPVGPNGKVARSALPAPRPGSAIAAKDSTLPSTDTEKKLAAMVGTLVAAERGVGVRDNLLELGLHSLLATSFLNLVRNEMGATLPMKTLFEQPTLRALAKQIDSQGDPRAFDVSPGVETPQLRNCEKERC